jgi:hypothetical protein
LGTEHEPVARVAGRVGAPVRAFFATHDFLTLALLFVGPPAIGAWLRPDLRARMRTGALLSLPFALTERFFLAKYWSPTFLFDLAETLGFGIEDLLFVASFGAFAVTGPCLATGERLEPCGPPRRGRRAAAAVAALLGSALALHGLGLSMYSATIATEAGAVALVLSRRRDLWRAAVTGGLFITAIYGAICLAYEALLPGVFARVWHTEGLFDRTLAGVPLEELVYGASSGALATVLLPWARGERYAPRERRGRPGSASRATSAIDVHTHAAPTFEPHQD